METGFKTAILGALRDIIIRRVGSGGVHSLSHIQLFAALPMDCSTTGSSVLYYLPEFARIDVQ